MVEHAWSSRDTGPLSPSFLLCRTRSDVNVLASRHALPCDAAAHPSVCLDDNRNTYINDRSLHAAVLLSVLANGLVISSMSNE
jgi:hypothetical protein